MDMDMDNDNDNDEGFGLDDLLPAPESPVIPPYSFSTYTPAADHPLPIDHPLIIRLVGSHPLWGHHLWNTARTLSDYLLRNPTLTRGKRILELGAGAGLPSLVAALDGADRIVITDYPDQALVDNISWNVDCNLNVEQRKRVDVKGYVWGSNIEALGGVYDLLLLSDLVFNHSQHRALVSTVNQLLATDPNASILVFFTHHRPQFADADMGFLSTLCETGWEYERVVEEWTGPMFDDDPGDERVRGTVHGFRAWRQIQ